MLKLSFRVFLLTGLFCACAEANASEPTKEQKLGAVIAIVNTLLLQDEPEPLPPIACDCAYAGVLGLFPCNTDYSCPAYPPVAPVDSTGRACWYKTERLNTDRLAVYAAAVETIDNQVYFCKVGNYTRTKDAFERRMSCGYDEWVEGSTDSYYSDLKKQLRNCQYDEFSERG